MSDWDLTADLELLAAKDADIARALARFGSPPERRCAAGFAGLARMIVFQQVSGASGSAIWKRLEAGLGKMKPANVLRSADESLRGFGLSWQKSLYLRAQAQAVEEGSLDLDRVHDASDDAAIQEITRVKGLGVWSAQNYLLFALERRDIFPSGDLALRLAAESLKRKRKPLTEAGLSTLARAWSPCRSAAAHFLWHYYGCLRDLAKSGTRTKARRA